MTPALPTTLPAFFWHFIKPYKWRFAVIFLAPIMVCVETTIMPYVLKIIVDAVETASAPADALPAITGALLFYVGIWTFMITFFRWQEWLQFDVIPPVRAQIRLQTMSYVMRHSHRYFSDHFAGSLANKVNDLARSSIDLLYWVNWQFTSALASLLSAVAVTAFISPIFSVILLVWFLGTMTGAILFARRVSRFSERNSDDRSMISGKLVDAMSNMFNIRAFAHNSYEGDYLAAKQAIETKSHRALLKQHWYSSMIVDSPVIIFFAVIAMTLVAHWKSGQVTTGDFVYVLSVATNVSWMVWRLGTGMHQFFDHIGVCRQALALVNKPHGVVDAPEAKALAITRGEIVFDQVHFHYIPGRNIFSNKSLTIAAGEKVGLVGFSGSGKSTFVNLILRLYDVDSGRIIIDGQDIARVTQDSLRESIAMIPQDTSLFHRTLMENIRYGNTAATDEDVINAAKKAHCHDFIMQTEHGYDSLVGERGVKLSGGQRQRIAIARAILKNAPILILDEATSSLDSVTEKYIQQSLAGLMAGRTTIVVAHRLSTLAHLDRILVFREGEIIEEGSHTALLAAGGHYAMLWNMQAGGFLPENNPLNM